MEDYPPANYPPVKVIDFWRAQVSVLSPTRATVSSMDSIAILRAGILWALVKRALFTIHVAWA